MQKIIPLLLYIFSTACFAQNKTTLEVEIAAIENSIIYKLDTNQFAPYFKLVDLEVNIDSSESVQKFLDKKILNKLVFISCDTIINDTIVGALLYDYEKNETNTPYLNYPVKSGTALSLELIQLNYVNYTGRNWFLKNLSR